MSISALLDFVPAERRYVRYSVEDGKAYVEHRQDVAPVIRAASILSEGKPGKDFTRVALIPKDVLNRAFLEGWFHDETAWKRWANASENQCFRTTKGTI